MPNPLLRLLKFGMAQAERRANHDGVVADSNNFLHYRNRKEDGVVAPQRLLPRLHRDPQVRSPRRLHHRYYKVDPRPHRCHARESPKHLEDDDDIDDDGRRGGVAGEEEGGRESGAQERSVRTR